MNGPDVYVHAQVAAVGASGQDDQDQVLEGQDQDKEEADNGMD